MSSSSVDCEMGMPDDGSHSYMKLDEGSVWLRHTFGPGSTPSRLSFHIGERHRLQTNASKVANTLPAHPYDHTMIKLALFR
jgi:hypothetical protein